MEVRAIAKNIRISPRKVRLIADAIRGKSVTEAENILYAAYKAAATPLTKVVKSAVANAINNAKLDKANLFIASIQVSQGQALKRFRPSTRGRIHPYKKRGSTVTVVVAEKLSVAKALDSKVVEKAVEPKEEKKNASASSAQGKGGKK
jgi:large subunit ribosomal protein L22